MRDGEGTVGRRRDQEDWKKTREKIFCPKVETQNSLSLIGYDRGLEALRACPRWQG